MRKIKFRTQKKNLKRENIIFCFFFWTLWFPHPSITRYWHYQTKISSFFKTNLKPGNPTGGRSYNQKYTNGTVSNIFSISISHMQKRMRFFQIFNKKCSFFSFVLLLHTFKKRGKWHNKEQKIRNSIILFGRVNQRNRFWR